jgi:hypothetical protein
VGVALFVLWLAYRYVPRLAHFLKIKRERHLHSEATYFRSLIRACRRNDAHEAYRSLLRWLRRSGSGGTLNGFLQQSHDEELTQHVNALTETLFAKSPNATWNGRIMASRLRKHRDTLSLHHKQRTQLPLLNPL